MNNRLWGANSNHHWHGQFKSLSGYVCVGLQGERGGHKVPRVRRAVKAAALRGQRQAELGINGEARSLVVTYAV